MTDHKYYIIDKKTNEVEQGPYPDAAAANAAADHYDWFDNDKHEIAHGTHELKDDDSEPEDHGSHGWFIMRPKCPDPVAGPFDSEDEAKAKHYTWLEADLEVIEGMISSDGKFYPH